LAPPSSAVRIDGMPSARAKSHCPPATTIESTFTSGLCAGVNDAHAAGTAPALWPSAPSAQLGSGTSVGPGTQAATMAAICAADGTVCRAAVGERADEPPELAAVVDDDACGDST